MADTRTPADPVAIAAGVLSTMKPFTRLHPASCLKYGEAVLAALKAEGWELVKGPLTEERQCDRCHEGPENCYCRPQVYNLRRFHTPWQAVDNEEETP